MADDFATRARPHLEARLEPGEQLHGVIAATYAKTFSGSLYAIGVTDRRLLLQPLDRRIEPKGDPRSVPPEAVASAKVDGAGDGWWTAPAAILDSSALTLRLVTRDGEKYKLMFMKGGEGLIGGAGGGASQHEGVAALGNWMQRSLGGG